jgi:hypothetical protein
MLRELPPRNKPQSIWEGAEGGGGKDQQVSCDIMLDAALLGEKLSILTTSIMRHNDAVACAADKIGAG